MRKHVGKGGRIPLFGGGKQPLQTVHVADLVSVIDKIISQRITGLCTVAEPEPIPYRVFYEELCRTLGAKPRFIHTPYWFVNVTLRTAETLGIRLPVNSDNLLGLKTMQAVDSRMSLEKFSVSVRNYRESLRDLAKGSGTWFESGFKYLTKQCQEIKCEENNLTHKNSREPTETPRRKQWGESSLH